MSVNKKTNITDFPVSLVKLFQSTFELFISSWVSQRRDATASDTSVAPPDPSNDGLGPIDIEKQQAFARENPMNDKPKLKGLSDILYLFSEERGSYLLYFADRLQHFRAWAVGDQL